MFDPKKTFLGSAFEPDEEQIARASRQAKKDAQSKRAATTPTPPKRHSFDDDIMELSSDDDMPDLGQILAKSSSPVKCESVVVKRNVLKEDVDMNENVEVGSIPEIRDAVATLTVCFVQNDDLIDSTLEENLNSDLLCSKAIVDKNIRDRPSEDVIATWKRGNVDLEPSTKMVALVDMLKTWDIESCYQDKVICFSQCA